MSRHKAFASGLLAELLDAAESGDIETVKRIAQEGFDMNQADRLGVTALSEAVRAGQMGVVRYLVDESYADIHKGFLGSALHGAVSEGMYDIALFLLERGAKMDMGEQDNTPFDYARRRRGRDAFLDLFISRMDVDRKHFEFFKAAQPVQTVPRADSEDWLRSGRQSYLRVIEAFIRDKSFDLNVTNNGSTALHLLAVWEDGADFVKALVAAGADTSLCDKQGRTAEEIALAAGNTENARILAAKRVRESLAAVKHGVPVSLKAPKRASFKNPKP